MNQGSATNRNRPALGLFSVKGLLAAPHHNIHLPIVVELYRASEGSSRAALHKEALGMCPGAGEKVLCHGSSSFPKE